MPLMNVEYSHVYCIPTHRSIPDENLIDYVREVAFAQEVKGVRIPFVLLDDSNDAGNQRKLASIRSEYRAIDFLVLTQDRVKQLYDQISRLLEPEQSKIFLSVYPDAQVNYGNTLNKCFLIATLLK